jgi:hypothetical protein
MSHTIARKDRSSSAAVAGIVTPQMPIVVAIAIAAP